jgi:arylsulfatase A-like enzyme
LQLNVCAFSFIILFQKEEKQKMKNKKSLISTLVFSAPLLTAFSAETTTTAPKNRKNIVVILVDDLGRNDLGCYGSTFYETPNIDKLAKESMLFTNGYAAHPVCSPTRAAIMTGKNPCRKEVNITDWIRGNRPKEEKLIGPEMNFDLPLSEETIAEALKSAGYATWFIGKWHLGETEKFWPKAQGFDVNIGGYSKGSPRGGYYSPYKNPKLKDGPKGEYLTDRLTNEAINLLEKRDKSRPFFLFLSFYTVHAPIQACKRYLKKFQEKAAKLPEIEKNFITEKGAKTRIRQDNPKYASMIYAMDENVGRLLDVLKKEGLNSNTVLFFTGDNGSLTTLRRHPGPSCLSPMRAGKGWAYEGGIRVPFIVRDPDLQAQNTVCNVPVVNTDFYATILDYCGLPQKPEQHKDSIDLKPLIEGKTTSVMRKTPLVWHYPHYHGSGWTPGSAIREGKWKLVESYQDGSVELYDLQNDLGEHKDLAKKYPEKTSMLLKKMHDYLDKVGASMPKKNPNYKNKTKK